MDFAFLYITSIFFIIIFVIIYTVCREKRPKQIHDSSANQNNNSRITSSTSVRNERLAIDVISSNRLNDTGQQLNNPNNILLNQMVYTNGLDGNVQKLQDGLPSYDEAVKKQSPFFFKKKKLFLFLSLRQCKNFFNCTNYTLRL